MKYADTPTTAAATLRADRRAGALLAARRKAEAAHRRGRLAERAAVTAVRSGGRLVVVSPRETT